MFLKGEMRGFPPTRGRTACGGPTTCPTSEPQYDLRRAAVRICEACPVRAECLAFGIMVRDQYGIYGGLPLRARRQVLKNRSGGRIPVRPERPDRRTAARTLHPREPGNRGGGTRTRMQTTQYRAADRTPATMARHHTLDRQGEGPGRRHTHPALAGHPLLKTIQSGPARPSHLRKPVYAANRGTVHPWTREAGKPLKGKNHERGSIA